MPCTDDASGDTGDRRASFGCAASATVPALLEREDGTLVAWYRFLYAPRTGGAYDSHHRTAGIVGRARRRGSSVAVRGTGAAAGDGPAHGRDPSRCRRGPRGAVP